MTEQKIEPWAVNDPSFPPDLQPQIKFISHEVALLTYQWDVFLGIYGVSGDQLRLLDQAGAGFFRLTEDMFCERFVLIMARLLDPDRMSGKDNATFKRLYKGLMTSNRNLACQLEQQTEDLRKAFQPMRDWRNQAISHNDLGVATKVRPMDPVTIKQLRECIERCQRWVDTLRDAYDVFPISWHTKDLSIPEALMDALRNGVKVDGQDS